MNSLLFFLVPAFFSGFAGLTYEVLWLKQLGLLFGNTTQASAATISAFFLGLAGGSYYWGKRVKATTSPLRLYALLELAIAGSSLLFFVLSKLYYIAYTPLFVLFGHQVWLFTGLKFLCSVSILFIPCFFMGGTFPVLADAFIDRHESLGTKASLLYAINTLGAALGVFWTSFYFIVQWGIIASYGIAISINLIIGLFLLFSSQTRKTAGKSPIPQSQDLTQFPKTFTLSQTQLVILTFISGFLTLCLEVLYMRMFALVLHNSVYSFGIILITFIAALGLGSFLAHRLCSLKLPSMIIIFSLLLISSMSTGVSGSIFHTLTKGLSYTAENEAWGGYIGTVFIHAILVVLIPGIFCGSIFPFLMKISPRCFHANTGFILGSLTSINTIGSALGAVFSGFLLIAILGLWKSIFFVTLFYWGLALLLLFGLGLKRYNWIPMLFCTVSFISIFIFNPSKYPLLQIDHEQEVMEDLWEGSYGSVSVVRGGENLSLVVDNNYILGDLSALDYEKMQSHLPLLLHPQPDSVFYLGMGTGITAGAALSHPVSSITICELIPEVIKAAKKHFTPYVNGLFTSSKVRIIAEDGRNFLQGSPSRYDVIISDLFIPWGVGTGSLYASEHYKTVYNRLKPGGFFAQWLPLFQVSKQEFNIITKTMLENFPQVILWRSDFFPTGSIIALIGYREVTALQSSSLVKRVKSLKRYSSISDTLALTLPLVFYGGNLSANKVLFEGIPRNSDYRPLVEYLAPITQRMVKAKETSVTWFEAKKFLHFYEILHEKTPVEKDPYLEALNEEGIDAIKAGLMYYKGMVLEDQGELAQAEYWQKQFFAAFPSELANELQRIGFQYIGE